MLYLWVTAACSSGLFLLIAEDLSSDHKLPLHSAPGILRDVRIHAGNHPGRPRCAVLMCTNSSYHSISPVSAAPERLGSNFSCHSILAVSNFGKNKLHVSSSVHMPLCEQQMASGSCSQSVSLSVRATAHLRSALHLQPLAFRLLQGWVVLPPIRGCLPSGLLKGCLPAAITSFPASPFLSHSWQHANRL